MMPSRDDYRPQLQSIAPSAAVWQRYDRSVKADLWSSGLRTATGVYLVDPVAVDHESLTAFIGNFPLSAVVVTNENHLRDSISFCSTLGAPLLARAPVADLLPDSDIRMHDGEPDNLEIVDLPGAPGGEIAIVSSTGELVIGDALINFEPYGFAFLPEKYCTNRKQMRESLRSLLDYDFERILFAHGTPIMRNAHQRLESLLASAGTEA